MWWYVEEVHDALQQAAFYFDTQEQNNLSWTVVNAVATIILTIRATSVTMIY